MDRVPSNTPRFRRHLDTIDRVHSPRTSRMIYRQIDYVRDMIVLIIILAAITVGAIISITEN